MCLSFSLALRTILIALVLAVAPVGVPAGAPPAGADESASHTIVRPEPGNWHWLRPPLRAHLAVWGFSEDDVWAVGQMGRISHFDGTNWQEFDSGASRDLIAIWAAGPDLMFAVGEAGTIIRWDGSSWTKMESHVNTTLHSVWGAGRQCVYACGDLGTWLRFDGDGDWKPIHTGAIWSLRSTWVTPDGLRAYAVGNNGMAFTWSENQLFPLEDLRAFAPFFEGDIGPSINASLYTPDKDPRLSKGFGAIWGTDVDDIYVIAHASIIHFDGSSWKYCRLPYSNDNPELADRTDVALLTISGTNMGSIYVGGMDGTLLNWNGEWWRRIPPNEYSDICSVHALNAGTAWVVRNQGYRPRSEYRGSDDGSSRIDILNVSTLRTIGGDIPEYLYGIVAYPGGRALATTNSGKVLAYENRIWSTRCPDGSAYSLSAITGSGPDDLHGVAPRGIVRWDGRQWRPGFSAPGVGFAAIACRDTSLVVAVGKDEKTMAGVIACRLHGKWALSECPEVSALTGVVVLGPDSAYACGSQGEVLRFDGSAWVIDRAPDGFEAVSIAGSSADDLYVSGRGGLFKRNDGEWVRIVPPVLERTVGGVTTRGSAISFGKLACAGDQDMFLSEIYWGNGVYRLVRGEWHYYVFDESMPRAPYDRYEMAFDPHLGLLLARMDGGVLQMAVSGSMLQE